MQQPAATFANPSARLCGHCRGPIEGPPFRRDGVTLHTSCWRDYRPPAPEPAADFVPRWQIDREVVLSAHWRKMIEKYRRADAGEEAGPAERRPANNPDNLKDGERLFPYRSGPASKRGRPRLTDERAAAARARRNLNRRNAPRAEDPENFRPIPTHRDYMVAIDGRVIYTPKGNMARRRLLWGTKGDVTRVRLTACGITTAVLRAELVRIAWGDAAAKAVRS